MFSRFRFFLAAAAVALTSFVAPAAHAISNHSGEFTLLGSSGSTLGNITNSVDSTTNIVGFEFYLGSRATTNLSFNLVAMADPLPAWLTAFDVSPSGTAAQGLSFDATLAGYVDGVTPGAPMWFGTSLAYAGTDSHFEHARLTVFYKDGFEKTIYLDPAKEFAQGQLVPYFDNTTPVAVPEPGTLPLLIAGIGALAFTARRRRNG